MRATGLFDKIFHRAPKGSRFARTMNGLIPLYGQFGTDIYASDVVQQAVKCIVDEIKKLKPTHIRFNGSDPVPVKGTLQSVLNNPNPLMTTLEFLEKTAWLLLLNYNVFIIPTYYTWTDEKTGEEQRYYEALYPIKPSQVDFIEDASGRLYVRFVFWNGYETTIPYDDVIHIRYNYSVNEFMGGNEMGQPDNKALLKTLELNEQLLQGVAKAMNASYNVTGILKYNTYLDDGDVARNLEEFEKKLENFQSGILPIDLKTDYTPLKRDSKLVDKDTLEFIDSKILRYFGVPLQILTGDFTSAQYDAFYQKTLEGIITAFSQAFTKKLFTKREKAFGNRIEFYPKELIFLSVDQTLELINTLAPQGGGYVNEYRTWLGLRPLPELVGKRYMSLNWIDADNASAYQAGKVNIDIVDEEKEEI